MPNQHRRPSAYRATASATVRGGYHAAPDIHAVKLAKPGSRLRWSRLPIASRDSVTGVEYRLYRVDADGELHSEHLLLTTCKSRSAMARAVARARQRLRARAAGAPEPESNVIAFRGKPVARPATAPRELSEARPDGVIEGQDTSETEVSP